MLQICIAFKIVSKVKMCSVNLKCVITRAHIKMQRL